MVVGPEVLPDILQEPSLRVLLHGVIKVQLLRRELQLLDLEGLGWQRDDGPSVDLVALEPPHGDGLHHRHHMSIEKRSEVERLVQLRGWPAGEFLLGMPDPCRQIRVRVKRPIDPGGGGGGGGLACSSAYNPL